MKLNKPVFFGFTILFLPFLLWAQDEKDGFSWPREIIREDAVTTLYQPQLESFEGDVLTARMAVSYKKGDGEMNFGALWFSAKMKTDLEYRIVYLKSVSVTQTRFPEVSEEKSEKFSRALEKEMESWDIEMSLDRLLASLELVEERKDLSAKLNNEPPVIYYRTQPAVLIFIDGDPILEKTDDENIEYVVNTPYFLVLDKKSKNYYINGAKWWYTTKDILKEWKPTELVPSNIESLADQIMEMDSIAQDSAMMAMKEAPELIVSSNPSELVIVDGEPEYVPIEGTSLLFIDNTEDDIIMDINSQEHYLLLGGRWFHSRTLKDGDWKFQEPENLPDEFSLIPAESDIGNVRNSVPGTEEANAAILEQSIPQTAVVDRKTATVEVTFDGEPEFEQIEGAKVKYAKNSDKTVLLIESKYYCVDDGIWFVASTAKGPYAVSDVRPAEVDDIPPSSEVYNVKYVYIYASTPEVVYVGYTPGYTCSYVYGGVVVYGTGYYYNPWYRTYYYPRPVTYGFRVHYNPWTGWGFSWGMSYGWFSVGFHHRGYGMWGPGGYRYGYRHGYRRGYHHGYRRGYNAGRRSGYRAGYRAGSRNSSNMYRNRSAGVRSTGSTRNSAARNNQARTQSRPSSKPNNMYTDKGGNVYRQQNSGNVQQRSNGQWQNSQNRSGSSQVSRESRSRQQGSSNYNNYNRSRSSGRAGGGSRGGGRRR